jgi:hypothetical protein
MDIQPSDKKKVKQFLRTTKVRDALSLGRPIITVDDTDSVIFVDNNQNICQR